MDATAIFLGAGATKACGGPTTNEILPAILRDATVSAATGKVQRLQQFLQDQFHILPDSPQESYPGLPMLMSLLDTAIDRRQGLDPAWDANSIVEIREAIEFGIFDLLEEKLLAAPTNNHWELLNTVYPSPAKPRVISTNYDLIIDTAMMFLSESRLPDGAMPAYHCAVSTDFYRNEAAHFGTLLKLHGSLNWLHCKSCQRLEIGASDSKKFLKVLDRLVGPSLEQSYQPDGGECPTCQSKLRPLLVAPTHLKNYRNPHLGQVWYEAERVLREAGRVIFIGYSLPEDDVEVIYLLKRSMAHLAPGQITVVDFDPAMSKLGDHPVGLRYRTLFGDGLDWHPEGLDAWLREANLPMPGSFDAVKPVEQPAATALSKISSPTNLKRESIMDRTHTPIVGSERKPLPGAVSVGRANAHTVISVSVKLRRKNALPMLTGRPAVAMTRQGLAEQFGAAQSDIDAVVQAFTPFGLRVVDTNPATRTVKLSGPVSAMELAFQVKLFNYTHSSGDYRGRVGAVNVPTAVKDIVQGVFGLDNRRVVRDRRDQANATKRMHMTSLSSAWYIPSELAAHYNFPAGDGSGQCVGLLEFGGGYFPSDLQGFCQLANISSPTVIPISVDGTATNAKDGAEGEVMLDIEVIAGVCPKAHIAVYFAQFTEQGWITGLDAAVHDQTNNPGVLSASWGESEDTDIWTVAAMTQVNETLQEAAMVGVTVCIASGDDGSSDAVSDGHAHVDFPSASPYVLSVGGTTIPVKGGNSADIVWMEGDGLRADNGGSTGGGVSAVFPRPAWQSEIAIQPINPGAIVGRCIPDLAANADWNASPYLLFVDGSAQPNGGTSAATPLVAGLLTLINAARAPGQRVGFLTPILYQASAGAIVTVGTAGCIDVQSGNNNTASIGGFSAGPGYDAASGWGTPNGQALAQVLAIILPVAPAPVNLQDMLRQSRSS
jgi:kumamolisin